MIITVDAALLSKQRRAAVMPQTAAVVREFMEEFPGLRFRAVEGQYRYEWKWTALDICEGNLHAPRR